MRGSASDSLHVFLSGHQNKGVQYCYTSVSNWICSSTFNISEVKPGRSAGLCCFVNRYKRHKTECKGNEVVLCFRRKLEI